MKKRLILEFEEENSDSLNQITDFTTYLKKEPNIDKLKLIIPNNVENLLDFDFISYLDQIKENSHNRLEEVHKANSNKIESIKNNFFEIENKSIAKIKIPIVSENFIKISPKEVSNACVMESDGTKLINLWNTNLNINNEEIKKSKVSKKLKKSKIKITKSDNSIYKENIIKQWNLIVEMRKNFITPLDKIFEELQKSKEQSKALYKYQLLVYLILSQRAKDVAVLETILKFKAHGFTCENMSNLSESQLTNFLTLISFHHNKTLYIRNLSRIIKDFYNGDPPETIQEILDLPGIGPKMSGVYLNHITENIKTVSTSGIILRVANRLKWIETDNIDQANFQLEKNLPKEYWSKLNIIIDGFGNEICTNLEPICHKCLLKDSCDFKVNNRKFEEKLKKKKKIKVDSNVVFIENTKNLNLINTNFNIKNCSYNNYESDCEDSPTSSKIEQDEKTDKLTKEDFNKMYYNESEDNSLDTFYLQLKKRKGQTNII